MAGFCGYCTEGRPESHRTDPICNQESRRFQTMRKNILFTVIILAVLLVAVQVLFVGSQTPIPTFKSGDLVALSRAIVRGDDHVPADELGQWIVEGRKDYLLIDMRPRGEYDGGHIDTATHVPLPDLFQDGTLEKLPTDRSIIVYSNGTADAAQAVVVLRCAGLKAYSLLGGYNFWQKSTLTPELAGEADEEALQLVKRKATAWYFSEDYQRVGGLPMGGTGATAAPAAFTPPLRPVEAAVETAEAAPDEPAEDEDEGLIVEEGC